MQRVHRSAPTSRTRVGVIATGALVLAACAQTATAPPTVASAPRATTAAGAVAPGARRAAADEAAAPEPGTARARPTRITVAATGDFLIHDLVFAQALSNGGGSSYDFRPMFRRVRPFVNGADIGICHFETPMAPGPADGYPSFNTPRQLAADAKTMGWDLCDTASNHTLDRGQVGIDSTIDAVRAAGLIQSGSATSRRDARRISMVEVKGIRVALLAYTDLTNGQYMPHRWSLNLADADRIKSDAARARAAGARIVIVNLHWGDEFQHGVTPRQNQLARQLTKSPDIDAIIGQHVHVVQPIRWKHGKPIVYGEGNLVSNQTSSCCGSGTEDGILALLKFVVSGTKVRVQHVNYVPVTVRHPDFLVVPIGVGIRRGLMDSASLAASYDRTVGVIGRTSRVTPIPSRIG